MKPTKIYAEEAVRLLKTRKVLRTDELMKMLDCAPQTMYIKLSQCKYISSINEHRRFLTLAKTPQYDSNGLWEYRGAMFSKWGNMKKTIVKLIADSPMGLTPGKLSELVKTTITPQLLSCLKEKKVIRLRFGRNQVYFSSNESISKSQIKKREKAFKEILNASQRRGSTFAIGKVHFGFLAQLILSDALTPEDIYTMLDGMGKSVERKGIKEIIIRHNLVQKKTRFQLVFLTKRRKNVTSVNKSS